MVRSVLGSLLTFCIAVPAGAGDNWPRWRGPGDVGHAAEGSYPVRFGAEENVLWKVDLPGMGCSTPIVWENQVVVTCSDDGKNCVVAHDWSTGEELWRTRLGAERPGRHRNGSGANPSPATDGESVFAYFKSGELAALDLTGEALWSVNLQDRFGKDTLYWDLGTSPVLTARDVVVAVMDQGESFVAAFDKKTGELNWKQDRTYQTPQENDQSYATPVVIERDGKEVILVWGAEHVTAHRVEDGSLIWSCGGFNRLREKMWPAVSSLVVTDDVAVVPFGRRELRALYGVKLGGTGDVTATNQLWVRDDVGTFIPTPVAMDGKVLVLRDEGEVTCVDADTGKTLWEGKIPGSSREEYYASPVVADGKLYAPRLDGTVLVAKLLDDGLEVLAENDMGERIIASPALLRDRILIRGEEHLFCIGER